MRNQADTIEDCAAGVIPCAPWRLSEATALPDFKICVKFVDGTSGEVDLSRLVKSVSAGVFSALRDPAVFKQVKVENGVAVWPGEIDLAPDAMYDEIEAHGKWVPE